MAACALVFNIFNIKTCNVATSVWGCTLKIARICLIQLIMWNARKDEMKVFRSEKHQPKLLTRHFCSCTSGACVWVCVAERVYGTEITRYDTMQIKVDTNNFKLCDKSLTLQRTRLVNLIVNFNGNNRIWILLGNISRVKSHHHNYPV